jgi:PAS domain S-box-containing protein
LRHYYADGGGCIRFWNVAAESFFGHSAAEASGKRVDMIVPEEHRAMHWTGFNLAIGSAWRGSEGWGPVEGLHKNGARVALEVFLTPVQEVDERAKGVLAIFRPPA